MMTTALTYATEAEAQARCAELDTALGYPKAGVDIGGGIHAPAELSRTLRHVEPVKHPKRDEWAVPIDEAAAVKLSPVETMAADVLASDWTAAPAEVVEADAAVGRKR
jgi:hypothetical protein